MKYTTPAAFRAALDQRLKAEAERTGLNITRLRKRVAFELFLRRLVAVGSGRWVLKGAFALDLRLDVATRPTKDIDLGRDDSVDAAIEDITAAQELDLDDYMSFTATAPTPSTLTSSRRSASMSAHSLPGARSSSSSLTLA